jgi:5-methylcytosine-specific restriction endonuclease McrA
MSSPEYQRQWRESNKDKLKAYHKLRYRLNKSEYIKRAKDQYSKDPEAKKEYQRLYYAENKDKVTASNKNWQRKNIDKVRQIHADVMNRRRARLRQSPAEKYNRNFIFDRFGGYCIVCNESIDKTVKFPSPMSFTIHHLIPISKGGADILNNVAPAHFRCNVMVGSKIPIAVKPRVFNV